MILRDFIVAVDITIYNNYNFKYKYRIENVREYTNN